MANEPTGDAMANESNGSNGHKGRRGFASMPREKQREIASQGGRAAHEKGTAHEWNAEEARTAGKKGGQASRTGRTRQVPPNDASGSERATFATPDETSKDILASEEAVTDELSAEDESSADDDASVVQNRATSGREGRE
jgi:general stress protein YciG